MSTMNSDPLGKITSYSPFTAVMFSAYTVLQSNNYCLTFCFKYFLTVILKIVLVAYFNAFVKFIEVEITS